MAKQPQHPVGNQTAAGEQRPARKSAGEGGGNRPAHEARLGRVKATVWANHTERGVYYSTVFARLYKDGEKWETSQSFGREDLPLVAQLAQLVLVWCYTNSGPGDPQN
jgi:hypothetical protein